MYSFYNRPCRKETCSAQQCNAMRKLPWGGEQVTDKYLQYSHHQHVECTLLRYHISCLCIHATAVVDCWTACPTATARATGANTSSWPTNPTNEWAEGCQKWVGSAISILSILVIDFLLSICTTTDRAIDIHYFSRYRDGPFLCSTLVWSTGWWLTGGPQYPRCLFSVTTSTHDT